MLQSSLRTALWSCALIAPLVAQATENRHDSQTQLRLRFGTFDPLTGELDVPPQLRSRAGQSLHIVQFVAPPTDADRAHLRDANATVVSYLPDNAYVVRTTAQNLAKVRAIPTVRWTGAYHPA